ncbi:putative membrane protein [Gelidibacter algens]|uniref:Putative membrane protein n=1 Tax=Gelidibacter algens TaxID=49280 RepID=A0A1A7R3X0_9FLAO|nr:DUF2157 domain-containing protein [Gelidibacter algens]OBX26208.1 hypothetical protein A9996_05355 [Gelidibacter algens]RAJ22466.1 putative membrane protein [Gelidibacter algens]
MKSKIIDELPELVKNQVISEEIALRIRNFYQSQQSDAPGKLFTVFGVLGALLVGLGIILILAHNWDDFSRSLKTFLAFLPLIIGQFLVGYAILKKKSSTWKEASGTFLFFAVGGSIALVSQIYNIPGDLSAYVLIWIVLCLPLIYLLKSHSVAILHTVFSTFYACSLGYGFNAAPQVPWLYLLLMVLMLPHYVHLLKQHPQANMTSIFNWLVPLSVIITLGAFLERNGDLGYLMYVILFGLFYSVGKIPAFHTQKLRRNGYLIFGSFGTIILLLITSFNGIWDFKMDAAVFTSREFYITSFLFCLSSGLLVYLYRKQWLKRTNLFHFVFIIFTVVFFSGLANGVMATIAVNVLVLALGLITIKIGTDQFHFGILNYGLLIITALIVCRFFDTDMSYIIRGFLFVSVGIGFFFTNYVMLKKKKSILKSNN